MASLPPGWAADYDGTRWFFRYAATDHTQYHFPTPGDEFPDFYSSLLAPPPPVSGGSGDPGGLCLLLPEEKLESERQVRKRATVNGGGGHRQRDRRDQEEQDDDGDVGGEEMCFEAFGYLGPGGYDHVVGSSIRKEDVVAGGGAHELANKSTRRPSVDAVSSLASTGTGTGTADVAAPTSKPLDHMHRAFTVVSEEQLQQQWQQQQEQQPQPLAVELPSSSNASAPAHPPSSPQPPGYRADALPMLDSREISPSPVGHIAELVSESTARCEEEIHPPPVELPDTNGASWLEPVPVPNLVNQYPVELPAVKSRDSVLETLGARREAGVVDVCRDREIGVVVVGCGQFGKGDENRAAWRTNWMSASASASTTPPVQGDDGPPRPPKVGSRSDLTSRHGVGPEGLPRPSTCDERWHREELDSFPSEPQPPERTAQSNTGPLKAAPSSNPVRHMSMTPTAPYTSRIPSVLRPGARRSSQPPSLPTPAALESPHTSPSSTTSQAQAAVLSPPSTIGAGYKAFSPAPAGTGRPHSQSAAGQPTRAPHLPPQVGHDTVIRMPNPKDHVRAICLPRSSTLPTPDQQPPPPAASALAQGPRAREPLHFVIPVHHSPTARGAASGKSLSRRPGAFVKMPSEPARAVGMAPEPPRPLNGRRASDNAPEVVCFGGDSGGYSSGLQRSPTPTKTSFPTDETAEADEGAPPVLVESASTPFAKTVGASNFGHSRLRQILKRIGRIDGGEGKPSNKPTFTMITEDGPQPLPHDYIPPKGRQKEATEWSVGHVE